MTNTDNYYLHQIANTVNDTTYPANQSNGYYLRRIIEYCSGESEVECQNNNYYYRKFCEYVTGEEQEPLLTNNNYLHQIANAVSDVEYLSVKSSNFYLHQICLNAGNIRPPSPKADTIFSLDTPVIVYTDEFLVTGNLSTNELIPQPVEGAIVKLVWGYGNNTYEVTGQTDENGDVTFSRSAVTTVTSYKFKLVFEGNNDYNGSASSEVSVTPDKEVSILDFESYSSSIYADGQATISAILKDNDSPAQVISGATVLIKEGNTTITTATTGNDGKFTKLFDLAQGTHNIDIVFEATGTHEASTNSCTIVVNNPTMSIVSDKTILSYVDSDSATLTATVQAAHKTGKTISVYDGSTLLGTMTEIGNGVYEYAYASRGVGDTTLTLSDGSLLTKTYEISDLPFYSSGASVNSSLQIDSGVSCTSNGTYLSISTSTSGEKYVYLPVSVDKNDDWEWSFEIGALGTSQHFASQLIHNIANPSDGFVGFFENVGDNIRMNGSDRTGQVISSRAVVVGDVLKWVYENGTLSLKLNNDTLYSSSVSFTDNPTFRYYTNSGRQQHIKNIVFKPL